MPNGSMPYERSLKRTKSTRFRMEVSPQQYKDFMQGITNGLSIETASWNAGINPKTVRNWLEKGQILAGEDLPPHSQAWQYQRFSEDHEKSRAKFEALHSSNINNHAVTKAPGEWTASAWMLERRRSKDYGQHYQVEKRTEAMTMQLIKFLLENASDPTKEELISLIGLIPELQLNEKPYSY